MRHVPIAEFKDRLSEFVGAVGEGDSIAITRHGREVARLVGPQDDVIARRQEALAGLAAIRDDLQRRGITVTRDEIVDWIAEGRERR